jgi:hypothetical protein
MGLRLGDSDFRIRLTSCLIFGIDRSRDALTLTSHEELAADDGPATEAQDVRSIEEIAMEAGAMAVHDDLERVHEWAEAARKRLIQLGRPDVVLAVHVIEKVVATRNAPARDT